MKLGCCRLGVSAVFQRPSEFRVRAKSHFATAVSMFAAIEVPTIGGNLSSPSFPIEATQRACHLDTRPQSQKIDIDRLGRGRPKSGVGQAHGAWTCGE
jgi:hypothetical protein